MSADNASDRREQEPDAHRIRRLAAEVWRRVEEWHSSPAWRDTEGNRVRYAVTADAISALDAIPDTSRAEALAALVDAVQPITDVWRPNRAGPEQAIFAAVNRLRDAVRHLRDRR